MLAVGHHPSEEPVPGKSDTALLRHSRYQRLIRSTLPRIVEVRVPLAVTFSSMRVVECVGLLYLSIVRIPTKNPVYQGESGRFG